VLLIARYNFPNNPSLFIVSKVLSSERGKGGEKGSKKERRKAKAARIERRATAKDATTTSYESRRKRKGNEMKEDNMKRGLCRM